MTRTNLKSRSVDLVLLAAVSLAGIVARLLYSISLHGSLSVTPFPDENNYYLAGAEHFLREGWSYFLTRRSIWNGPGNILWVALLQKHVPLVKLCNLGLLAVAGILIWDITRRLFSRTAAWVALVAFTVHPPLARFGPTVLSEPPFIFSLVTGFWLCMLAERRGHTGLWFASGTSFGFATLVRPTLQLFPVMLLLLLPFTIRLRGRHPGRSLLALLAGFLILVLPWAVKNRLYLGKFGIATGVGAVLYLGNDLRTDGDEPVYSEMDFDTIAVTLPYTHLEPEGDKRLIEATRDRARKFPVDTALLVARKPLRFLFGSPVSYFYPFRDYLQFRQFHSIRDVTMVTLELLLVPLVVVAGIAGIVSASAPTLIRALCGAIVVYFVGLHALTFPIPRLGLPMFPFLLVFAAGFLTNTSKPRVFRGGVLMASIGVTLWLSLSGIGRIPGIVADGYARYFEQGTTFDLESAELHQLHPLADGGFEVRGRDPYLVVRGTPVQLVKNQVFLVRISAQLPGVERGVINGQVFWQEDGKQFRERKSKRFPILADGESRLYRVSPSLLPTWKGEAAKFRLDLGDGPRGLRVRVESFELRR